MPMRYSNSSSVRRNWLWPLKFPPGETVASEVGIPGSHISPLVVVTCSEVRRSRGKSSPISSRETTNNNVTLVIETPFSFDSDRSAIRG